MATPEMEQLEREIKERKEEHIRELQAMEEERTRRAEVFAKNDADWEESKRISDENWAALQASSDELLQILDGEVEVDFSAERESLQERIGELEEQRDKALSDVTNVEADFAAASENLRRANLAIAAGRRQTQTQVIDIGTLPRMSLVYVSLYMAVLVLLVLRVISYFDIMDGTFIDAFYFTSVTVFTVGFGDIIPKWSGTLLLCDMLGMFGCIIPSIYSYFVGQMADWLYQRYLSGVQSRRRRLSYLMLSVAGTILVLILSGMAAIYYFEGERLRRQFHTHTSARIILDTFHLTVMTMTTIGYGDFAFATAHGRAFAALWIPFSTTIYTVAMSILVAAFLDAISRRSIGGHTYAWRSLSHS